MPPVIRSVRVLRRARARTPRRPRRCRSVRRCAPAPSRLVGSSPAGTHPQPAACTGGGRPSWRRRPPWSSPARRRSRRPQTPRGPPRPGPTVRRPWGTRRARSANPSRQWPTRHRSTRRSPIPSGRRPGPTARATAGSTTTRRPETPSAPAPRAPSCSPDRWRGRCTSRSVTPTACARATRSCRRSSRPSGLRVSAGDVVGHGRRAPPLRRAGRRRVRRPRRALLGRHDRRAAPVRGPSGVHAAGRGPCTVRGGDRRG